MKDYDLAALLAHCVTHPQLAARMQTLEVALRYRADGAWFFNNKERNFWMSFHCCGLHAYRQVYLREAVGEDGAYLFDASWKFKPLIFEDFYFYNDFVTGKRQRAFAGTLPWGLSFDMTCHELERRFGRRYAGISPWTDTYHIRPYVLEVSYDIGPGDEAERTRINTFQITLANIHAIKKHGWQADYPLFSEAGYARYMQAAGKPSKLFIPPPLTYANA